MKKTSRRPSKKTMLERKILAMLAFFSTSVGLWENFRQLWLQDNGFTAADVSIMTSVGLMLSVVGVIFVGYRLKMRHLKAFMTIVLGIKLVDLLVLRGLDASVNFWAMSICTVVDVITSYLIVASVYPLITVVIKNNEIYSKRKLVEYWFRDIGVLVGGVMLGQTVFGSLIDYNACLVISVIFLSLAVLTMSSFKVKPTEKETPRNDSILKYVLKSKLQVCYMIYAFLAAMSFAAALGLKMLVLTNYLEFSAGTATNYLLIVGILSDVVGVLALKYFTPKNDYLTLTLKFGIRLLAYIIAIVAEDPFISMIAFTWSILISTAYEDVTDGCYINLVDNRHQLSYSTIKHVMSFAGEAMGMLLCGVMYDFGIGFILGASSIITVVQIGVAFYLVHLRHHRRSVRHSASRMRYDERLADE
jgi:hypothetical protein